MDNVFTGVEGAVPMEMAAVSHMRIYIRKLNSAAIRNIVPEDLLVGFTMRTKDLLVTEGQDIQRVKDLF